MVDTSYDFAQFREWLQNTASDHTRTQFFNCTEVQGAVARRKPIMLERDRAVRAGLGDAVRQAQRCVDLIDSSPHGPGSLQKLAEAEAVLKQTTKTMTVLALMDQRVIQTVIERCKTAQTQAEQLQAARMLYPFIVDDGQRLLGSVSR